LPLLSHVSVSQRAIIRCRCGPYPLGVSSGSASLPGSPLAPEGEFKEVGVARGFWPHIAAQMEVERLANFQVECVGMLTSRVHGRHRTVNWVNASEYAIGVFLAEEAVPQSRRGAKLPQRDRRVFLRAAVYHKELLLVWRGGTSRVERAASQCIRALPLFLTNTETGSFLHADVAARP